AFGPRKLALPCGFTPYTAGARQSTRECAPMPTTSAPPSSLSSAPAVAAQIHAPPWAVRRACDDLGIGVRIGPYRAIPVDEIPRIKAEVLARYGYPKEAANA